MRGEAKWAVLPGKEAAKGLSACYCPMAGMELGFSWWKGKRH